MMKLDNSVSNDELCMQGNDACKNGFFNDAIADYTSSIKKNKTAQAFNNRGYAYYRSVDRDIPLPNSGNREAYIAGLENAIKDFEEAIKIDPNYQSARDNLIIIKQKLSNVT